MNIREVEKAATPFKVQLLKELNKRGAQFPDCYKCEHAPGVASLFQPINGDPYVVIFTTDGATIRTFTPDNRESGTDAMRARILAALFYNSIKPEERKTA